MQRDKLEQLIARRSIFVDAPAQRGWKIRGRNMPNAHLFTTPGNLEALHRFAKDIGCKREWAQNRGTMPHYDLTPDRYKRALMAGAVLVPRAGVVALIHCWRKHAIANG